MESNLNKQRKPGTASHNSSQWAKLGYVSPYADGLVSGQHQVLSGVEDGGPGTGLGLPLSGIKALGIPCGQRFLSTRSLKSLAIFTSLSALGIKSPPNGGWGKKAGAGSIPLGSPAVLRLPE